MSSAGSLQVVCAWCGRTLREPPPEVVDAPVSHGLCAGCAARSGVFPVEDLHGLTEADLDRLPFGAVELDPAGVVLAYNRGEEQLTGLDRTKLRGKNFFTEVAPCTRVKEFGGRYAQLVSEGAPGPVSLRFVFRLAGGDRLVSVRLSYDVKRSRGFVLVQADA